MKRIFVKFMRGALCVALAVMCLSAAMAEGTGAAVINQDTYVFQTPSLSSAHMKVSRGTGVELVAVKGQWAMVKKGGVTAYMNAAHVTLQQTAEDWDDAVKKLSRVSAIMLKSDKVYKTASKSSASMKVSAGTRLNLVAVSGDWALVEKNGVYAYTPASSVASLDSLKSSQKTAVIQNGAKVYSALSTKSSSVSAPAGTTVNVLAVMDQAALIEKSGVYGFIAVSALADPLTLPQAEPVTTVTEPAATTAPQTTTTTVSTTVSTTTQTATSDYFNSDKYTNEQKCFIYLTKDMGLNTAAACGILASAKRESGFKPTCTTGKYYGLFQWADGRLSNLKSFCSANGLSYSSVEGQMKFMRYELENTARYASLVKLLQTTPNTAQGAYDAAYQFCYVYERPGNIVASSEKRGGIAQDTYFPKYNK